MLTTQTRQTPSPTPAETYSALQRIASVFGLNTCWLFQCRYHFSVGAGWTIALSDDSAGRFRLDTCHHTRTVTSAWVLGADHESIAGVALALRDQLNVPAPARGGADEPRDLRGFSEAA